MGAHSEEFASRGQKYQTCLILSSRPREANFLQQFPRTLEETAGQTASRGSLLSSFLKCAAGLRTFAPIATTQFFCPCHTHVMHRRPRGLRPHWATETKKRICMKIDFNSPLVRQVFQIRPLFQCFGTPILTSYKTLPYRY